LTEAAEKKIHRVGIAGTGAIALASAAWLRQVGHAVMLWSPGGQGAEALRTQALEASGVQPCRVTVEVADDAAQLCHASDVLLLALPVNGHRHVMDALLPFLRDGQTVIVSSMASLSSLYLFENARNAGKRLTVASFGTTVLTARRESGTQVKVMTRRKAVGVSALPGTHVAEAVTLCAALFGDGFFPQDSALASALANVNPQSHGPLAVFNWTRIERAENWPQYHCMTPGVSRAIEALDQERTRAHRGTFRALLRHRIGAARGHRGRAARQARRPARPGRHRHPLRDRGHALRPRVHRGTRRHRRRADARHAHHRGRRFAGQRHRLPARKRPAGAAGPGK
jgi:opine dehydrogenase